MSDSYNWCPPPGPLHGKEIAGLGSNFSLGMPLIQWPIGKLCASCFDAEAERAGVRYGFVNVTAESWNEQPAPRNPYKCKRSSRQEGNKNAADRPKATGRLSTLAGT